jgi:hypothetical protein
VTSHYSGKFQDPQVRNEFLHTVSHRS